MSNILINLTQKGWALPVLGALMQGHAARIHPLAKALQTSPLSIKAAVDHLMVLRLVVENPGHGHPLRPEFMLTSFGEILAPKAKSVLRYGAERSVLPLMRKRWTLPIISVLDNARSFGELRRSLTPITDRALSLSLKGLTNTRLVRRKVLGHHLPPTSLYVPTPQLVEIRKPLGEFLNSH